MEEALTVAGTSWSANGRDRSPLRWHVENGGDERWSVCAWYARLRQSHCRLVSMTPTRTAHLLSIDISIDLVRPITASSSQLRITPRSSPKPRALHYPRHPFSAELCADISALPVGFHELAVAGFLSTELIHILGAFQTWLTAHEDGRFDEYGPHECMRQARECISFLLSSRQSAGVALEQALCLALIMLGTEIHVGARLSTLSTHLFSRLLELCERKVWEEVFGEKEKKALKDAFVWVLIVAAEAGDGGANAVYSGTFLDMVFEMHAECGDVGGCEEGCAWTDLEGILERFFTPRVLVGEWRECWERYLLVKEREVDEEATLSTRPGGSRWLKGANMPRH